MTEFVQHEGRKYWLQSSGRYFQSGVKTDAERLLHRRIWSDANGPIPDAHHVHHIDGDWRNNALENLECVLGVEHQRDHMLERNATADGRASTLGALAIGAEAAKRWHSSPEGLDWHRQHGRQVFADRPQRPAKCDRCGTVFWTRNVHIARYCSSACQQAVSFRTYFDDPRSCAHCSATFLANRHRPTRFCSRTCSNCSRVAERNPA